MIDPGLVQRLAERLGWSTGDVERGIVGLSVESRLMLPILSAIPRFAAARTFPSVESVARSLRDRPNDMHRAIHRIRRVAEDSERHLIEANLRLVSRSPKSTPGAAWLFSILSRRATWA
jgi:hypothetical protein